MGGSCRTMSSLRWWPAARRDRRGSPAPARFDCPRIRGTMNAVGVRRTNRRFIAHGVFFASVLLVPAFVSAQGAARAAGHAAPRPLAVLPGFEELDDGSTRLFVDLSAPAAYETKAAKGTLTYVLKEAQVAKRNNCNPLV